MCGSSSKDNTVLLSHLGTGCSCLSLTMHSFSSTVYIKDRSNLNINGEAKILQLKLHSITYVKALLIVHFVTVENKRFQLGHRLDLREQIKVTRQIINKSICGKEYYKGYLKQTSNVLQLVEICWKVGWLQATTFRKTHERTWALFIQPERKQEAGIIHQYPHLPYFRKTSGSWKRAIENCIEPTELVVSELVVTEPV